MNRKSRIVNRESLKVEWCSREGGKRRTDSTGQSDNQRAPASSVSDKIDERLKLSGGALVDRIDVER